MEQLVSALERRGIEPIETGKNYLGFESADDASEAYVFLKRDFPSLSLKLVSDRVEVKGMRSNKSASNILRNLEMRIARLERTSATKFDADLEKVFEDLYDKLTAIAKAQIEAEKKSGREFDHDLSDLFSRGELTGHARKALDDLETQFKGAIQESRDALK